MKKKVAFILSLVISGAILVYLFSELDWEAFLREFRRINLLYVPVLIVLFLLPYPLRAIRWKYLLPQSDKLEFRALLDATVIGFFANVALPLRAGEFVRPWMASRITPVGFSAAFASIVTERVIDVLTLLFFFAISLPRLQNVPPFITLAAQALGVMAVLILVFMVAAYLYSDKMLRLAEVILEKLIGKRSPALTKKLIHFIEEFFLGLKGISSLRELVLVIVWSLAVWIEMALAYQVSLWAFGEYPSLWVGILVNLMIALAVAAPSAPGFIGTFQLGCVAALSGMSGYTQEFAMAYSIVVHVFSMFLLAIPGVWILHRRGLALADLKTAQTS